MNHNRFWLVFVRNWDLFNVFNRFQWPAFINEWFVNLHWRCLIDIVYATKSNGNSLAIIKVHCKATTLHWMESIQYCYRVLRWAGKPTKKKTRFIDQTRRISGHGERKLARWMVGGWFLIRLWTFRAVSPWSTMLIQCIKKIYFKLWWSKYYVQK